MRGHRRFASLDARRGEGVEAVSRCVDRDDSTAERAAGRSSAGESAAPVDKGGGVTNPPRSSPITPPWRIILLMGLDAE